MEKNSGSGGIKSNLMRYTRFSLAAIFLAVSAPSFPVQADDRNNNTLSEIIKKEDKKLYDKAKGLADGFLDSLIGKSLDDIDSLRLSYEVHIEGDWNTYIKLKAIMEIERQEAKNGVDYYTAKFRLTEPVGKTGWDSIWLWIGKGFGNEKVKKLYDAVKTKLDENIYPEDGRFKTYSLSM